MNWAEMNFFERVAFIVKHAPGIFVRAEIDGKWQSVAICDLAADEMMAAISRLAKRDVEVTRIVDRS